MCSEKRWDCSMACKMVSPKEKRLDWQMDRQMDPPRATRWDWQMDSLKEKHAEHR